MSPEPSAEIIVIINERLILKFQLNLLFYHLFNENAITSWSLCLWWLPEDTQTIFLVFDLSYYNIFYFIIIF